MGKERLKAEDTGAECFAYDGTARADAEGGVEADAEEEEGKAKEEGEK
jgi:hypothetical protein